MSAHVTGSYEFTAPAEVVFGVLTDPDRAYRWLPVSAHTDRADDGGLRMQWRAEDGSGLDGSAEVADLPAGGSVVRAEVTLPGDHDEEQARTLLAEAMRDLQRDVSDNFNAG
ncbi:SRPBCC domain-containing protein [Actinoplanes sp. NPDC049548]|uniref:SRPBCC family protein n=1 Tax=Actinoplanes sp. NPDC049548 TaxID=3155152 RepID=UPI0034316BAD